MFRYEKLTHNTQHTGAVYADWKMGGFVEGTELDTAISSPADSDATSPE